MSVASPGCTRLADSCGAIDLMWNKARITLQEPRSRGLSLVEVLVSLAVVAVLTTLALWSIAGGRDRARRAASDANLGTHARTMVLYADDMREYFPHFLGIGRRTLSLSGGGLRLEGLSFFDAHDTWHVALASSYYQTTAPNPIFRPPGNPEPEARWPLRAGYLYPCVFVTSSQYWDPRRRTGPSQWTGSKISDVAGPHAKAMISERLPVRIQTAALSQGNSWRLDHPIGFVDGSVRRTTWRMREQGYTKGDGYDFVQSGAVHFADAPPMLHTLDGVRGRDVR